MSGPTKFGFHGGLDDENMRRNEDDRKKRKREIDEDGENVDGDKKRRKHNFLKPRGVLSPLSEVSINVSGNENRKTREGDEWGFNDSFKKQEGRDFSEYKKLDTKQEIGAATTMFKAADIITNKKEIIGEAGIEYKDYIDAFRKLKKHLNDNAEGKKILVSKYEADHKELSDMIEKIEVAGKSSRETGTPLTSEHKLTNLSDDSSMNVDATHRPPREITLAQETRSQILERARKRWEGDDTSDDASSFKINPEMIKTKIAELGKIAPNRQRAYNDIDEMKRRMEADFREKGEKGNKDQNKNGQKLAGFMDKILKMLFEVGEDQEGDGRGDLSKKEADELVGSFQRMADYVRADNPADSSVYDNARKELLTSKPQGSPFGKMLKEKLQESETAGVKGRKS